MSAVVLCYACISDLSTHASSQKRLIQTKEDDNLEKDTLKDLRVFLKDKNMFDSPE